ncbi:McrB family protein [Kocuria tytonicola]|uniref:McrB family protein n=1 Tax=Kocuria tytonicola TaxID=2055946 RepID=UPI001404062C|nr:AAA family ATPase [Kocuria tytonicola]
MSNSLWRDLRMYLNVIVEGVAGCGKSHLLEDLAEIYEGRVEVVVFHPSTSYEDFVSGLRPQLDGSFRGEAGVFVEMCERAGNNPERDYLLFVDEINRANTSRVFGDLMLVLEASKRVDLTEEAEPERTALLSEPSEGAIALQTPVSLDDEPARKYLRVPRNLHILGTMNTTDRSVGTIDLALRRRFHWITMEPLSGDQLASELEAEGADVDSLRPLIDWYSKTNRRLKEAVGPDARLGHSYFFGEGKSAADIATGLLNQLKEVVATFNIKTADVDSIIGDGAPVGDEHWRIHLVGQGLGRRPEIKKVSATRSSDADGQGTSQGSDPEETSTAAQG